MHQFLSIRSSCILITDFVAGLSERISRADSLTLGYFCIIEIKFCHQ